MEQLAVGMSLAGYRVHELVGRGGMGLVYRAVDIRLGRIAALKIIAPQWASDEQFCARFLREARLAAAIEHPNILPVYEAGECDAQLYLAMRYVSGGNLHTLVRSTGQLDAGRVTRLAGQLAAALDAAHRGGVVHRDVKPANALVSAGENTPEHVYLTDFGIARIAAATTQLTIAGEIVGSPSYLAPEVLGGATASPASDRYALACVIYELLCGRPPFVAETNYALIYAHMKRDADRPSKLRAGLGQAVDDALRWGLAKDPAERPESCAALVEAMALDASQGTRHSTPASSVPPTRRSAREPTCRPMVDAAIFNVPVMTRAFVGRERALEQLAQGLMAEGVIAITQVHAIHGLGGIAKTQLAARYARVHRGDYDVVWWLRAEQDATLRADLAALAGVLGLVGVDVDERVAIAAARGWLERNSRWLLIFDNATAPASIAELLPEGEGGHVLITSRAHADWLALNARPLALDVWERQESLLFLRARTGERDTAVLQRVAELLGDLPLALEQAAAYTNMKAISLSAYVQRLRHRAPELFAAGGPPAYAHTVATAWDLAFEQLAQHPVAGELAGVCAHLAAERIPRELLDAWITIRGQDTVTANAVDDAIELLLRYALLSADSDTTVAMHRLVQQVARDSAQPTARARAAAHAVALLDSMLPTRPWEHQHWPVCERLLSHTLAATAHSEAHGVALEQTASVLLGFALYHRERARYDRARQLAERSLKLYETAVGPQSSQVANALDVVGTILLRLGHLTAARDAHDRAVAICETTYGREALEFARPLGNLGNVQRELGEFEAAGDTFAQVVAICETVYGPQHPNLARALGNLGTVQQQLGELHASHASQQRALAIKEAVYGPDDAEIAITLANLGLVQQQLGELEAAAASQQRALAIFAAVYGGEHPAYAGTLGNLAIVQRHLGDLQAARQTQQRALAIQEGVLGPSHPEVAMTLGNLAIVQQQLGDLTAARKHARRAHAIFQRTLGTEHPYTVQAHALLANVAS